MLPRSTTPITVRHSEGHEAVFGCASVTVLQVGGGGIRGASLYDIWGQQTELLSPCFIVYTLHASVLGFCLKERLLYCLYLVSERWCLFSEAGRLCLFHSATIKLNLPLSVRGEFKNPSVCVTEQKWYQAKHNLTDSLEHALRKTISRW